MIERNEELTKLLKYCIKDKKLVRKDLENIWYEKFEPSCKKIEEMLIIEKEKNQHLTKEEFLKAMIKKVLYPTILVIINEYAHLLEPEKLNKLKGLLNIDNIKITYLEKGEHDISADIKKGNIIININNKEELTINKMVKILGTLPHEVFHFLYQLQKKENEEHARYLYDFEDGKHLHFAPGKVGTILSEGFVEKKSNEFCERNNIFYIINPSYAPYVKICDYFTKTLGLTDIDLLTSNYEIIFLALSLDALNEYLYYEGINVLQNFTPREYKDLEEEQRPKIEFDKLKKISIEELEINNISYTL